MLFSNKFSRTPEIIFIWCTRNGHRFVFIISTSKRQKSVIIYFTTEREFKQFLTLLTGKFTHKIRRGAYRKHACFKLVPEKHIHDFVSWVIRSDSKPLKYTYIWEIFTFERESTCAQSQAFKESTSLPHFGLLNLLSITRLVFVINW